MGRSAGFSTRRGAAFWVGWLVALAVLWLVLVGQTSAPELVTGTLTAALGATAATAARRVGLAHFAPRGRWLVRAWQVGPSVARGTPTVLAALVRRLRRADGRGRLRTLPFDPGSDDARAAARRALVVASRSASPDAYVLGADAERRVMLVHELTRGGDESRDDPRERS